MFAAQMVNAVPATQVRFLYQDGMEFQVLAAKGGKLTNEVALVSLKEGMHQMESLEIPSSVSYKDETFTVTAIHFCRSHRLRNVMVPSTITKIENAAFGDDKSLTEMVFPNGAHLGNYVCWGCTSLKKIVFPKDATYIPANSCGDCGKLEEVVLPEKLLVIEDSAFSMCTSLRTVLLPDSLVRIETGAFNKCGNLETLTLPPSIETLGVGAFRKCPRLTLRIPKGAVYEEMLVSEHVKFEYVE